MCVSEQRKRKTKCFLPEAGLGLLYPTGLSFLLPFSAASALREIERGWEFRRKSLRFNYMLHVHRMENSDLWKHPFMILPCKTNAFMSSLHINKGKSPGVW